MTADRLRSKPGACVYQVELQRLQGRAKGSLFLLKV